MNTNKGAPKTRRTATQEASYYADREPKKKVKKEVKNSKKDAHQDDYMDNYSDSGRSDSPNDSSQSSPNIHGHHGSKHDDYDDDDNPKKSGKKSKARHDNSLSVLTKKFVELIKSSPGLTLDLNEAVKELNVQKRRIYDITNVLEGIGYIEKILKNKIKWIGNTDNSNLEEEIQELQKELEQIEAEEKEIDQWINTLQENLTDLAKDEANAKYAYVTHEDIKSLGSISQDDQNPFLVIKAPKGTTLEVPTSENDNLGENKYQLFLKSTSGEITVYVVSEGTDEPAQK
eukprot:CAMPEP_0176410746 /NCGR_PEP_ID=MMETSP0127-20121128/3228_1 /TAXON_ID=938130 /ORGANISM="Platyophrya macrostoma, Strain WH" /LENGTH=286 /DNA_ID=CAMNT_0017790277 /DNA_START=27 /DNA_END=887 /DNA_ORIENTATION=-